MTRDVYVIHNGAPVMIVHDGRDVRTNTRPDCLRCGRPADDAYSVVSHEVSPPCVLLVVQCHGEQRIRALSASELLASEVLTIGPFFEAPEVLLQ